MCASSNPAYYGEVIAVYNEDWSLYGIYECCDKGPQGIDIYFENHNDAKQFGRKTLYIKIIKGGKG